MPSGYDKRAVLGWAMYDWANSAFVTTVVAGFFPVFFKEYYSAGVDAAVSTARLGLANSLAGVAVALAAPALGAIADLGSARKKLLLAFAGLGAIMSCCLYLVPAGSWAAAAAVFAAAVVGFSGANIFYDALLPAVSPEGRRHQVSSLGYALGYLGGGLLFAVNVLMVLKPSLFGISDAGLAVKISFLTVGAWWALFTVPLVIFVREPGSTVKSRGLASIADGFRQLSRTLARLRHQRTVLLFLAAYWCYIDGVDTVIRMAVDYGLSLGFPKASLITALLITQFVGFPSALGFGWLGARIGAKRAIYAALAVYVLVTVWGAFMRSPREFYILAVVVGLVQGGVQALSRSLFADIVPAGQAAELFGFYNMLGKFAVVLGPALMGVVALASRSLGAPGHMASRLSISSVAILFLIGWLLLSMVDERKARAEFLGV